MLDITYKQITLRTATASGKVTCGPETVKMIREDRLPKGNLLDIAKAAGLLAAKKTDDLIPHCHPVAIDGMQFDFEVVNDGVEIQATGKSIGRTGIEMEVLTAVSVAALTIYDLLKPVDKNLEIVSVKLLEKKGGKSDKLKDVKEGLTAAILVCSDSTAEGTRLDKSGKIIEHNLTSYNVRISDYQIVPDDKDKIQEKIKGWIAGGVNFIFTTGGTGFGPRDNTVDAVKPLFDKYASGIVEAMRVHGMMRTPRAMLSRSVAGIAGKSVIVTLPGSSRGAQESLDAILPGLFHAESMIAGEGHDSN